VNMENKLPDLSSSKTGSKGKSQDTGEIFPF
jgi:hypothetical protein